MLNTSALEHSLVVSRPQIPPQREWHHAPPRLGYCGSEVAVQPRNLKPILHSSFPTLIFQWTT
eukprot:5670425-Pyramimonas_sp.AAC.2